MDAICQPWESVRFASERSRVRIPSGPPIINGTREGAVYYWWTWAKGVETSSGLTEHKRQASREKRAGGTFRKREENPFRFIDNAKTRACRWVCQENSLLHFVKRGGILVQNKVGSCFIRGLIAPHRCDSSGVEFGRILSHFFYYRRFVPCCNFKKTTR